MQAQQMYCAMMWLAYERMARCYGALMLLVYVDFCLHGEQKPDAEERWRFRQWHFPQLYLAGLPLDFLDRPQLRWLLPELQRLWSQGEVKPDRYDYLAELLGIYGILVRDRREADRRRKSAPPGTYTAYMDPNFLTVKAVKEWSFGATRQERGGGDN